MANEYIGHHHKVDRAGVDEALEQLLETLVGRVPGRELDCIRKGWEQAIKATEEPIPADMILVSMSDNRRMAAFGVAFAEVMEAADAMAEAQHQIPLLKEAGMDGISTMCGEAVREVVSYFPALANKPDNERPEAFHRAFDVAAGLAVLMHRTKREMHPQMKPIEPGVLLFIHAVHQINGRSGTVYASIRPRRRATH